MCRFLLILGHQLRYGADVVEAMPDRDGNTVPIAEYLATILTYVEMKAGALLCISPSAPHLNPQDSIPSPTVLAPVHSCVRVCLCCAPPV